MPTRATPACLLAAMMVSVLPGPPAGAVPPSQAGAAVPALAQLDARERELRREFIRQQYERDRRRREEAWRERREAEGERRREWTEQRRSGSLQADCRQQAERTRETLEAARDASRIGGGAPGFGSAEAGIDAMRRSGCDPLQVERLEQELRSTRQQAE